MGELIVLVERVSHSLEKMLGPSPALSFLLLSAALFLCGAILTRTRVQRAGREHKSISGQRAEDGRV
ncbi:hypothetical protein Terro_1257 [Terriglobus roseus DSM 18391]|uniref:Uncharacterized protein n=1 Tax=Terriglobus roseus (strain DSM 18391 / NRRL B-41598 / KBS 63) TaxID=926566 RepID=I3ZE99_TERRK|nr:hypothetical protein [Terriglobus roseus]AFL87567.1 hypothetical protein Terro_1257 [Terriglobus roseus DSM 18391]